jgi:energy-coupling factor transporter transmembrane protein EcfT
MVVLRSLDQAEKSHEAMTARGYRGRLPLPAMPRLPWRQVAVACAGVAAVVAAYILAERWPS